MKVETERMLSIGRFARLSGLTVKALRHYDDEGVLKPAYVDPWTGYRYYASEQLAAAVAVRRLRALRMPLEEIASLIRAEEPELREALALHRARLAGELVETRHILRELDRLIEGKEHLVTELTFELSLVEEPAGRFAVVHDRVRVDDMFTHVPEAIMRVREWLDARDVPCVGPPLAIFLGIGVDEWLEVEVGWPHSGVQPPEGEGIAVRELPATRAVEHIVEGPYEQLPDVYRALESAIRDRGLKPQDLAREHYVVNPGDSDDPAAYRTRIVWPVA
jgi:DNA-binding transcriptional MerR regulator